jgi:TatA/E family protein of Tat protein translocase
MNRFGLAEIAIIVVVFLVFFGRKRLPVFFRGLGNAAKEYRKGLKGDQ